MPCLLLIVAPISLLTGRVIACIRPDVMHRSNRYCRWNHDMRLHIHRVTSCGKAALEAARRAGAVLLIAKLDRLARNVAFTSALMDTGVEFMAADMPDANRMTLHVMTALAEHEARLVSERTRAALAARKARGLPVGHTQNLTPETRALGPAAQREAARLATQQVTAFATALWGQGDSLATIASKLNASGFCTRKGGLWASVQVKRILDRI
ncbi:recombinase family protein [Deinococcus sp. A31D244]|uniref:recombinase family protein n=1 Tax=Deinococcus sp. A31D244 TaxID=3397675 RepID=UPI0039E03A4E